MKKAGIDTEGPKAFLQVEEEMGSSSESELENQNNSESGTESTVESQINAELATDKSDSESDSEEQKEKTQDLSEKDEVDDDDEVEPVMVEKKDKIKTLLKEKKIPYVFTQLSSKTLSKNESGDDKAIPAVKQDTSILYNAPAKKLDSAMKDKVKILREKYMRELQKSHVWTPSRSEREKEGFNKIKSQQGNKNADLFVSFLGYIRDTSYKRSPPLFEKIKEKYVK
jgi:hypothetical protein